MKKDNEQYEIVSAIEEDYVSVIWNHKIQEKQSDIYMRQSKIIGWIKIITSAFASFTAFGAVFVDEQVFRIISSIVSGISFIAVSAARTFSPEKVAAVHKRSAKEFLNLRRDFKKLLLNINTDHASTKKTLSAYSVLSTKLYEVFENAPTTTNRAVRKAEKELQESKDKIFMKYNKCGDVMV